MTYRRPWLLDLAALALLALAVLGFFWRVASGQNWMPADGGDLVSFLFPTYRFAAASLRDGAWPLWNPHVYGGAPHLGDIQAGFLYPPNLLLFLLNSDFTYGSLQALSMAHLWFAGAGMHLLLARGLRLQRVAALAGALAFMFADPFLTHFGNLNLNAALSWLPWIFWAWLRVLGRLPGEDVKVRHLLPASALTAVILALSITAGHIQATLFTLLALGVFTLLWLAVRRDEPRPGQRAVTALAGLLLVTLLAATLAAPVLLPGFQLAGATARAEWNYTATAGFSLSPAQLVGWLIPGFFGRGPQFHWGAWPRVEVGYLGILPLVLAGVALLLRGRDDRTHEVGHVPAMETGCNSRALWPWAGLAAVSFVLALGIYAIPHGWLTLLPGFGQLRAPARFVLLTDFAIAALAAYGLHTLLGHLSLSDHRRLGRAVRAGGWMTGAAWAIGVPLAYLALLLVQGGDPAVVTRTSITLIAVVGFALLLAASALWLLARHKELGRPLTLGWLAVGLIFLDVASLGAYQDLGDRDPSAAYRHTAIAEWLRGQPGPFRIDSRTQIEALWQPDAALLYGLEDVNGVANPLVLVDFERYWQALGSRSTALYDLLNVRYVLGAKDVVLDWDKFALAFDGDPELNVYENRRALPRAFIVPTAQFQPTPELSLAALQDPAFDPQQAAVITAPSTAPVPVGGRGAVTDIHTSRNGLTFRVNTDAPALVFVSQVWYPGWRVFIDGRPAGEPWRANYLFQGVGAPAGEHIVELRFAPRAWTIGWVLSAVALLVVLLLFSPRISRTRTN